VTPNFKTELLVANTLHVVTHQCLTQMAWRLKTLFDFICKYANTSVLSDCYSYHVYLQCGLRCRSVISGSISGRNYSCLSINFYFKL